LRGQYLLKSLKSYI